MKKILALLCGLAFASGAWASYTYTFKLTITCPTSFEKMSDAGMYYLINTSTKQAYVIWNGSDWRRVENDDGYMRRTEPKTQSSTQMITYNEETYTAIDATFRAKDSFVRDESVSVADHTKTVTFQHTWDSDAEILLSAVGATEYGGKADNLVFVIADPVLEAAYSLAMDPLTVTKGFDGRVDQFSAIGVMQSVPEPTSGLLLLLGVAGLALRRKRAA